PVPEPVRPIFAAPPVIPAAEAERTQEAPKPEPKPQRKRLNIDEVLRSWKANEEHFLGGAPLVLPPIPPAPPAPPPAPIAELPLGDASSLPPAAEVPPPQEKLELPREAALAADSVASDTIGAESIEPIDLSAPPDALAEPPPPVVYKPEPLVVEEPAPSLGLDEMEPEPVTEVDIEALLAEEKAPEPIVGEPASAVGRTSAT